MWCRTVGGIVTLIMSLLTMPLTSQAQPTAKVPRLGLLMLGSASGFASRIEDFRQGLHDLGYVEGQNLTLEYRFAEEHADRLPALAADLVRLRPDVIVSVGGTLTVRAAQQATTTIPIVTTGAGMLVEQGIVASLAHPGGNITGVETNTPELYGKRLELLKEAVPQIARVVFLANPTSAFTPLLLPRLETDARALGVQFLPVMVHHPDEFATAFAAIVAHHPDALFIQSDALLNLHHQQIMDFAATHRLPTSGGGRRAAEAGSLMAFGVSDRALLQRAAVYVDKILKGTRPGDLPIERPMKFELIINLKTAKALGITMPPSLLLLADEVIQ